MSKISIIGIAGESVFLTLDSFGKIGETVVASDIHREIGGKGFNQAIAVARYGIECSFLCAVNEKDVWLYSKTAKDIGINPFFIGKKESTPYAVIATDKSGENTVTVYRGATLEEKDLDLFAEEIKSSDILLINNETPISVNERAVNIAKANGVKVVLNPAPKRDYQKDFLEKIDLFTPNQHEIRGLEGFDNVIVTLGDKGCYIKSINKTVSAKKVKVVDTTGAGDTFNGVLCSAIACGCDIESACEKANVASAIKVGRKYILNGIPFKKEIDSFKE